jgi:hypothetical protein
MRKTFNILGWVLVAVWAVLYYFISELDCAFGPRSDCGLGMPWSLRGDDFLYLTLLPGLLASVLFFTAWWAGRKDE